MYAAAVASRYIFRRRRTLPQLRQLATQPSPSTEEKLANPNPHPLTVLRSAIKSESDPQKIFLLFQSSTHLPGFHHDRNLYTLTIDKLCLRRRPDLISQILDSQASDPSAPKSEGFLTRIIVLYSRANLLTKAEQLFEKIPNPTALSFSALLSGYLNHRKYDEVIQKFNALPKKLNIELGPVPYCCYIKALCGKGEVGAAREVIDKMLETKNLLTDILCYNAVLKGYMDSKDENGFNDMLKMIDDSGLESNVFTYNCRIMMLVNKKQFVHAEEMLDIMISKGVKPNFASFNTLIQCYCEKGDMSSAIRVFKRMRLTRKLEGKEEALPSGNTYVMLLRCLVKGGEFDLGLEICKDCLARRFAPPFGIVKGLIEGLVKNGKVVEAKDVAEKMNLVVKGEAVDAWKKFERSLAL